MKNLKSLLLLATVGLLPFASCKKTSQTATVSSTQKTLHLSDYVYSQDDAANPNNPYDNVGFQHNNILQATRSIWTNSSKTFNDVYTGEATYYHNNVDATVVVPQESSMQALYNTLIADVTNWESNTIASSNLSATGKSYANQLFGCLANIDPNAYYADFKNNVIAVEGQISQNQSLSSDEKQRLLTMASVLRHSTLYWLNESVGQNTDGSNPCGCRIFKKIGSWLADNFNVRAALCADAGGLVADLLTGGCATIGVIIESGAAGFGG
jgi:hypothetical protein